MKTSEKTIPAKALSISLSLKSFISCFPLIVLLIIAQSSLNLFAKAPRLAMLKSIDSNTVQRYQVRSKSFICKPYGVVTLEEIYHKSTKGSFCQKSIERFYAKNKKLVYYSESILKLYQLYRIKLKGTRCLIYAKGQRTLSEMLLSQGLALPRSAFRDKEFRYLFQNRYEVARRNRVGLWGTSIKHDCAAEMQNNFISQQ